MANKTVSVEETFKLLHRQYGTMSIKQSNELPSTKENIVSTGIMGLDIALGVGGIKKGSIVEIYGPESGGEDCPCPAFVETVSEDWQTCTVHRYRTDTDTGND